MLHNTTIRRKVIVINLLSIPPWSWYKAHVSPSFWFWWALQYRGETRVAIGSSSQVCMGAKSLWSCTTLCDPVNSSSPIHWILQERILEWVAVTFFRGSSRPWSLCLTSPALADRFLTSSTTWGVPASTKVSNLTLSNFQPGLPNPSWSLWLQPKPPDCSSLCAPTVLPHQGFLRFCGWRDTGCVKTDCVCVKWPWHLSDFLLHIDLAVFFRKLSVYFLIFSNCEFAYCRQLSHQEQVERLGKNKNFCVCVQIKGFFVIFLLSFCQFYHVNLRLFFIQNWCSSYCIF